MFQMEWFMDMVRKGYRPEQITLQIVEEKRKGSPMGENLFALARSGNTAEIEKIARYLTAQKGLNFDKEFSAFKKQLGLK